MAVSDVLAQLISQVPLPEEEEAPVQFPKPTAPDYKSLWETYAGWINNINVRTKGEFSNVRARLFAAGAPPDLIKMQTEHLESQRLEEVGKLKETETYKLLQEGYEVGAGGKVNPYSSMGGLVPASQPATIDEYYRGIFGAGPAGKASVGSATLPATRPSIGGPGGSALPNPWFEDSSNLKLI
jgi:hypothetical protein